LPKFKQHFRHYDDIYGTLDSDYGGTFQGKPALNQSKFIYE